MSSLVRWQENSSFASRRVGLCVGACKCAVLCVGCPFFFQSLSSKLSAVVSLFTLGGNVCVNYICALFLLISLHWSGIYSANINSNCTTVILSWSSNGFLMSAKSGYLQEYQFWLLSTTYVRATPHCSEDLSRFRLGAWPFHFAE